MSINLLKVKAKDISSNIENVVSLLVNKKIERQDLEIDDDISIIIDERVSNHFIKNKEYLSHIEYFSDNKQNILASQIICKNLIRSLYMLKKYEDLLKYIQKCELIYINFYFHEIKGYTFYLLKKYDEAVVSFEKSLSINQKLVNCLYHYAISLAKLKRFEEARTVANKYLLKVNKISRYKSRLKLLSIIDLEEGVLSEAFARIDVNDADFKSDYQYLLTYLKKINIEGYIEYLVLFLRSYEEFVDKKFLLKSLVFLRLEGKYTLVNFFEKKYSHILTIEFDKPVFIKEKSIKVVNKAGVGAPLIICFQGFNSQLIVNYYKSHKLNNLEALNDSELVYGFESFSRNIDSCNFIFVKDNYQLWYQLHIEEYLECLQDEIEKLKPTNIVCVGASAGGFAAILFGTMLNVDTVLSFSPRIIAFLTSMNDYRNALDEKYCLSLKKTADLNQFLKFDKKIKTAIKIFYCKHHIVDADIINKMNCRGVDVWRFPILCESHNVIKYIGKENTFSEIEESALKGYSKTLYAITCK